MLVFTFCSIRRRPLAELQDALPQPVRRDRSVEARREARLKKDARERRIISMLNRGVSMVELAAREGVTLRRMQIVVKDILVRRAPPAPSEYLALQVSPPERGDDGRLWLDGGRQSHGGRSGGETGQGDGPLSRLLSERRRQRGCAGPTRPAGAARPRGPDGDGNDAANV